MGGRTWQAHEHELLQAHVDDDNWLDALLPEFPKRSENALKCKMSQLRMSLGYSDGREVDASWVKDARRGTRMLGKATLRVGMWT